MKLNVIQRTAIICIYLSIFMRSDEIISLAAQLEVEEAGVSS